MIVHKRKSTNKLFVLWYVQNEKGVPGEPTIWFWPLKVGRLGIFNSRLTIDDKADPVSFPKSKVAGLFDQVDVKLPSLPTIPGIELPGKTETE